jgi:hypothetical protein
MTNWLTPETAIGARLPCGAVVKEATTPDLEGDMALDFDRVPAGGKRGRSGYCYSPNGSHYRRALPDRADDRSDGARDRAGSCPLIPARAALPIACVDRGRAWQAAAHSLTALQESGQAKGDRIGARE